MKMEYLIILVGVVSCLLMYVTARFIKRGFYLNLMGLLVGSFWLWGNWEMSHALLLSLILLLPMFFVNLLLLVFVVESSDQNAVADKYKAIFYTKSGKLVLNNIQRGVSIIGSAGSGKTESVVFEFLKHFHKYNFCGIIHDYKDFEITEMAYPIFNKGRHPFYVISFDPIYSKVNPIAPRYIPNEESVHEVSRVLVENLLELRDSQTTGSSRFFNDAVEGLLGGMMWRLKTDYPQYCTLPHLMALYQHMGTKSLVNFLSANPTSKAMANAFISGVASDRQTAGVKSTLANAFKKIATQRIFMTLSEDQVPLHINSADQPSIISIVNNPKFESSLSPIIATIIHTITKQISVREGRPSFLLMEEAPTLRLLNMHRIPATLRSYDISTIYVLQDKIQNDLMYGEKASRAILSNLSYQFFGKANDPDTAKYYERFFEIVKKPTRSINRGYNLNFDTRVTRGEMERAKTRADAFYGLRQGEFVVMADGKDKKVRFKIPRIKRGMMPSQGHTEQELQQNYDRIHQEICSLFKS